VTGVAAVIVTYRSAGVIGGTLRALEGASEVVVVDNASDDGTCDEVAAAAPEAMLIRNPVNRGFAAAVNQGVRATSSPLILLLNPDARPLQPLDELHPLVRAVCQSQAAAAGGLLLGEDGSPQRGFFVRSFPRPADFIAEMLLVNRIFPRNRWNRRYRMTEADLDHRQDCDQPAGAFLLFRRDAFERIGGFDERFFPLWFEDVDFCLRLRQAGYRIVYEPAASALHLGAHSLRTVEPGFQQAAWYGNLLRFAEKHFSPTETRMLRAAAALGLALRGVAVLPGGFQRAKAYFSVIPSALRPLIAESREPATVKAAGS